MRLNSAKKRIKKEFHQNENKSRRFCYRLSDIPYTIIDDNYEVLRTKAAIYDIVLLIITC